MLPAQEQALLCRPRGLRGRLHRRARPRASCASLRPSPGRPSPRACSTSWTATSCRPSLHRWTSPGSGCCRPFVTSPSTGHGRRSDPSRPRSARSTPQWYAGWAARLAAHSEGPESAPGWRLAVAEADNLRAAMDTAPRAARRLPPARGGRDDAVVRGGARAGGGAAPGRALAAAGAAAPARAIALTYWAWLRGTLNRPEAAAAAAERRSTSPAATATHRSRPSRCRRWATPWTTPRHPRRRAGASSTRRDRSSAPRHPLRPDRPGRGPLRCVLQLAAAWLYRSVPTALSWQQEALRRAELEGDRRIIAVNAARLAGSTCWRATPGGPGPARPVTRARVDPGHRTVGGHRHLSRRRQLAHAEGRGRGGAASCVRVFRSASSAGRPLHTVLGAAALADLYTESGRLGRAAAVLAKVEAGTGALADPVHVARVRVRRSRVARLEGRPDDAERDLGSVARGLSDDSLPPERVAWLLESAELAAARGDSAAATLLLDDLDAARVRTGVHLAPWETVAASR